ncbi:LysR family transcriptional regulator ArgP [Diaminobutyricibacter tongyongensis]|uniref:LysR family transcriptional regulator ArgP n=1 Tax=Leifsonia tongyongensis TaxID=1268043 RepID=A0A6L9Y0P7_9MICO|nr:LysR family transcriptional regulator ArgP [Diaminobutyricibacter tongyongensis]NEN07095.1 LysR family transcriptional regulator ArgP [Diaminobutyricibacter tongyongensis]
MEANVEHLRTLAAVVDHGSFERAAEALRITPSAVSQRIKALEQRAGRVLVLRSKPAAVTESGQVLLRLARQVALLEGEALARLGTEAEGAVRAIPLVVNADSLATWVLPALAGLDGMSFELYLDDQAHSTARLRDGTVVGAVTSDPVPVQGCVVRPLGSMTYRAVATPEFAARWFPAGPTREALAVAPMIVFDRKDTLQDRYLDARGTDAEPPRHQVPASTEFVAATALGLGWAMIPDQQSAGLVTEGRLIDLDPAHPIDVPLFWQHWSVESESLARVTDALAQQAALALTVSPTAPARGRPRRSPLPRR